MNCKALKYLLILLPIILLSACSTTPTPDTSYYLLDAPVAAKNKSAKITPIVVKKQTINLAIKVAEYLDQPYLIIQTDQYQVNFAQSHMWAEPLIKAITRTLRLDLNNSSKEVSFVVTNASKQVTNNLLEINIDYFHPNHLGKVILTGDYILRSDSVSLNALKSNSFHMEKALQLDGYHHSVKQMRALLKELAVQINSELKKS